MKFNIWNAARVALVAAVLSVAAWLPQGVRAQVVTSLPVYLDNSGVVYDFGNGPLEFKVVQGSAGLFTSSGTGVGSTSGSSTSLTLTAVPTTAPCVGCAITGTGLTTQTVAAFNGTTSITLSAVATVASSTALAWGSACPATTAGARQMLVQAGVGNDLPLYTTARICGASQFSPGATVLPFAIGAH